MDSSVLSSEPYTTAERLVERTIFASRWLLAPFYVGLAVSLVVSLVKFAQKTVKPLSDAFPSGSSEVITNVLSLIDLSLIASLVLMVMLACYENFVSRFELEGHKYKPSWMGRVDFGDLKLEAFMKIGPASDRELAWSVGILITFVFAALPLAIMNRLSAAEHH